MAKQKANSDLSRAIEDAQKLFKGSSITVSRTAPQVDEAISTGLSVLDRYLYAVGGAPVGRMTEIIGEENSAKTALSLHMLGAAQAAGCRAVLIDAEESFDAERAVTYGCDLDNLIVAVPAHAEMALEQVKHFVSKNTKRTPLMVVLDSVVGKPPQAELGKAAGEARPGVMAALMSREIPKIAALLRPHRAHLVCVNQVREKVGVMFGSKTTSPGGKTLKFHASSRFQVWGGKAFKHAVTKDHVGKEVTVQVLKTRWSPPWRKARLRLNYMTGWDEEWSVLELAKTLGKLPGRDGSGKALRGHAAYLAAMSALGWPVLSRNGGSDGGEE